MKLSDIRTTLITPTALEFTPIRVGAGSPKTIPAGTRVKFTIERSGDYGDEVVLRLILPKLVMGYKTYTWSRAYDSVDEMRADGFAV
jgi:hypothetical protein